VIPPGKLFERTSQKAFSIKAIPAVRVLPKYSGLMGVKRIHWCFIKINSFVLTPRGADWDWPMGRAIG
jgi:hypothetical protein